MPNISNSEPDQGDLPKRCENRLCRRQTDGAYLCDVCARRIAQRRRWASYGDSRDRLDAAEAIGVFQAFCRGGEPPSLDDEGLADRIALRPLPEGGLMAVGPVGTHKSHLLAARTIDAARRGWRARFLNWAQFCLEVRDTYKTSATETELDVLNRYADLDFLAIDDLGVGATRQGGKESEASRMLAYMLLDRRYAMGRVTDVSSNSTLGELKQRFDSRIARRLESLCTVYPMLIGK